MSDDRPPDWIGYQMGPTRDYHNEIRAERDELRAEVDRLTQELKKAKDAGDVHFGKAMAASFAYDKAMKELYALRDWADARVKVLEELAVTSAERDAAIARAEAAEQKLAMAV